MKFLIVQLGRIGDLILITPTFSALKEKYPDCTIDLFAGRNNWKIVENNPYLNDIIVFEKSPLGYLKTISKIFSKKYDYWIDPKDHKSTESQLFARISRSKNKIGFNLEGKKVFNIELPTPNKPLHHTEIGINSLVPLGIKMPDTAPKPQLYATSLSNDYLFEFLSTNKIEKYIALNLSASTTDRMWDNSKWKELFQKANLLPYKLIICSAPKEQAQAIELSKNAINSIYYPTRNINDVVSLVAKSEAVITPDTAVVHIAAAFNKPSFSLYNGIDDAYAKFYPLSDYSFIMRSPKDDFGIQQISVTESAEILNKMLSII